MPNFNYLKNNESDFPHIDNIDVYKFDNDFDYGRFDYTQMELQICSVPWDMGEAHVGNRTISGIGNVVYFGSKQKRDAWFAAIPDSECYRFETKFKELHRDNIIDVPIPYDMCAKHNYLVVRYAKMANENSPVQFEGEGGLREWFWFIREVEFVAPNTTRLHLLDDAFQTWIYDVNITGMILERGHAPMFEISTDEYLDNPIDNNTLLLTEDVNFGNANNVKHIDAVALNAGTMYACIATTANPTGTWGSKTGNDWVVPTSASYTNQGVPSVYVFALAVSNLQTFLTNITNDYPQFKQTIQGIFFASKDLITLAGSFTFASVTCYGVNATRKTFDFTKLSKSQFGYDSDYENIAKLYTSPYAHIEITDENGNVDIVKVEDTSGNIDVSAMLSIAYPYINIEAHLIGIGGNASKTVSFRNIYDNSLTVSGQWYETLRSWKVPSFAVVLDPAKEYDYSTHFDRAQRVVDYTTQYNDTSTMATASQSDRNASADLITDNALLTTTANTAITTVSNSSADRSLDNTRSYNFDVMDIDNSVISSTATSQIQATEEQAAVTAASGAATSAVSAVSSALSGDIAGAVSSAVNGLIGGAATIASTNISIHLQQAEAQIAQDSNIDHSEAATDKTEADTSNQKTTASNITTAQNTLTTGQAANASATEKANALRDYTATMANASRDQSRAQSAITNDIAQAALRSPSMFGQFANGESATTKPIALFANIVTQSKSAIASAGDEMLRYGYMLDRQWKFDGNWNVGKYFTYWKLRDFWVTNLNVPDMYMDRLRFFLFGGVTVWRKPEDIGQRTIYENFD